MKKILIALMSILTLSVNLIYGQSIVFDIGEGGSRYYRIPALVEAADGSLIAIADKRGASIQDLPNTISVVAKRSNDGGVTWGDVMLLAEGDSIKGTKYGDAAVVLDRSNGDILCIVLGDEGFFYSTPEKKAGIYLIRSKDNGQTWEEPVDITDQIYRDGWYASFCASGSMHQREDGTIMGVFNTRLTPDKNESGVYEFVFATKDGGESWQLLNPDSKLPPEGYGNESKIISLPDSTLLMSIRTEETRRFSRSTDGGQTWSDPEKAEGMIEPGCNGDIVIWKSPAGQDVLIQSLPIHKSKRRNVGLYLSQDYGQTWKEGPIVTPGSSAYSSLTTLKDGGLGILIEEWESSEENKEKSGYKIIYHRIEPEQLTKYLQTE